VCDEKTKARNWREKTTEEGYKMMKMKKEATERREVSWKGECWDFAKFSCLYR
jgi:hypothetical protein